MRTFAGYCDIQADLSLFCLTLVLALVIASSEYAMQTQLVQSARCHMFCIQKAQQR